MQQIYLKKLTKQDITKSVSICSDSVKSFWDIDPNIKDEYFSICVCHENNPNYYPQGITIHKGYGGEKDWRICGNEWKKLYADDNPEIEDLMIVKKLGNNKFSVSIVKKSTPEYGLLSTLLKVNDNYAVINIDKSPINCINNEPLQQIFYGAPGTGKSHKIKDNAIVKNADDKNLVFRTTFHPDSDYSTFVGAYKPTMKPVADKYKAVAGKDEEITYSFVPQAFLQAYIAAWNNPEESVFLIIEEINRGNCAQIFGDLFQLLDRDDEGFSEYPIMADNDLKKYLNGKDEYGHDVLTNKDGIKDNKLNLPKNLYIWATMNTSDQSLFPIDSAFKRRWNWQYIPISNRQKGYKIEVNGSYYDWWDFLTAINDKIWDTNHSEDKKLGYFFVKSNDGIIKPDIFVGKVIFYLWNDVFKDFIDESGDIFIDEDGTTLSFDKFYMTLLSGKTIVVEDKVEKFLLNLKLKPIEDTENPINLTDENLLKYKGEIIEKPAYRSAYKEIVRRVIADTDAEKVAQYLGPEMIKELPEKSTRNYQLIEGTDWYLAMNNGKARIKDILRKLKQSLGVDIFIGD